MFVRAIRTSRAGGPSQLAARALMPLQRQRPFGFSSAMGLRRLRRLEEDANRAPNDPGRQLALMQACNQNSQSRVAVRRYESGLYAADDGVFREYVRALALTDQLQRLPLQALAGAPSASGAASPFGATPAGAAALRDPGFMHAASAELSHSGAAAAAAAGAARGTLENPVHVQYSESTRMQMLRLLQRLGLAGLFAGALMMLVDEKALPKGLGLGNEVQPVVGSPKRFSDVVGVDEAKCADAPPAPPARASRRPRRRHARAHAQRLIASATHPRMCACVRACAGMS